VEILFITSSNIASNPRLTKELRIAVDNCLKCTVIQFNQGNWSDEVTRDLEDEFGDVQFIVLSSLRKPLFPWLISSVMQKVFRMLPVYCLSDYMMSVAIEKRSMLLIYELRRIKKSFSWVIAHTPAAFYPALLYTRQHNCRLGIDVEDYHPGELHNKHSRNHLKRLMKLVLPQAAYISYSSPLIKSEVNKDIDLTFSDQICVLNSFFSREFDCITESKQGPLRLIWFSQFIDKDRGLELLLDVIDHINDLELHLIGSMNQLFYLKYLRNKDRVYIHESIAQENLHKMLIHFDIGLALEPGRDLNNELAVSNKILAYAQAGLFILASKTQGQTSFLTESGLEYIQYDRNIDSLKASLNYLVMTKDAIRSGRPERIKKAYKFDFDKYTDQLLSRWVNE
jgi:glycosyltransferase involved in cell wall biosynthesis